MSGVSGPLFTRQYDSETDPVHNTFINAWTVYCDRLCDIDSIPYYERCDRILQGMMDQLRYIRGRVENNTPSFKVCDLFTPITGEETQYLDL
jgi:hypothetical protein